MLSTPGAHLCTVEVVLVHVLLSEGPGFALLYEMLRRHRSRTIRGHKALLGGQIMCVNEPVPALP